MATDRRKTRRPAAKKPASRRKRAAKPAAKAREGRRGRKHAPVTPLTRVTGIGGFFFKSDDPQALMDWYRKHLGIERDASGGWAFSWREKNRSSRIGYTVFGPFESDTEYLEPSEHSYMFNFRVADLHALLKALRRAGVHVIDKIEESRFGKFGWIIDPEGRKIELWEPPDADDPFVEE